MINYILILVCAMLSMVIGFVWYGPLFGKKWVEIVGATDMDMEARKKMQKEAGVLYIVQFSLIVFQVFILAYFINLIPDIRPTYIAVLVWAGFVLPTIAGGAMWNNDSHKIAWARFLIQVGYQLILFVIFGFVLGLI